MILIDYNQVFISAIYAGVGKHTNIPMDEDILRHMFLNIIRSVRKKFRTEYGEITLCCDCGSSWRKSVYKYYKAGRREGREASDLDWNALFEIMAKIRAEVKETFPYKVICIDHVEADDIIGVLCHEFGTPLVMGEKHLIYSSDKDYIQLQKYANVDQYNPVLKKWITHPDPDEYLMEHIIKGDRGDGVPNILSADDTLVLGKRQGAVTAKRMAAFKEGVQNMDEETKIRWHRNKTMVDLTQVPEKYKAKILEEYEKDDVPGRKGLMNYFIKHKLKLMMKDITDF